MASDYEFRIPFALDGDGRVVWRSQAVPEVDYRCHDCGSRVRLRRASAKARAHLFHVAKGPVIPCAFGSESPLHLVAKRALAICLDQAEAIELETCATCGPVRFDLADAVVEIEKLFGYRRADVGLTLADGECIAFEVFHRNRVGRTRAESMRHNYVEYRARDLLEHLPEQLPEPSSCTPGWLCTCAEVRHHANLIAVQRGPHLDGFARHPRRRPDWPWVFRVIDPVYGDHYVPDLEDGTIRANYESLGYIPGNDPDELLHPDRFIEPLEGRAKT